MKSISYAHLVGTGLLSLSALIHAPANAADNAASKSDLPALPKRYPISDGDDIIWADPDYKFGSTARSEYFYNRWNPITGELTRLTVPKDLIAESAASGPRGLFFLAYPVVNLGSAIPLTVLLLTPQGKTMTAALPIKRKSARLLALTDGSALVVGGKLEDGEKRTNAVERITQVGDQLVMERLPDLPGEVRHSVALVALADGRAMALGGSSESYTGCSSCISDTFILDPKTKTWIAGPKMLEARADTSATLLPNGDVLVVGGWTPGHGWNEGASRSTERWNHASNRFTADAALPIGMAVHKTFWSAGQKGKHLLLAAGMPGAWQSNEVILDYNVERQEWRTVGEGCHADHGNLLIVSGMHRQQQYVWCQSGSRGGWKHVLLRMPPSPKLPPIDPKEGFALRRGASAILPAQAGGPMLIAGGVLNDSRSIAAVDAVWPDGRVEALASLNHPRRDGQIFRLRNGGYLVAGGTIDEKNNRQQAARAPLEWLSGAPDVVQSRWVILQDIGVPDGTALGQGNDGSIIAVKSNGEVERIVITAASGVKDDAGGKATVQRTALAPLTRERHNPDTIRVRELADGRIIVAGGDEQAQHIAVLQEDSMQPDAIDKYQGVGEYRPSRRYEIYSPATKSWSTSAPSLANGGAIAILDNGQVAKLGAIPSPEKPGKPEADSGRSWDQTLVEISSTDGNSWSALSAPDSGSPYAPSLTIQGDLFRNDARLFVIQGELFLSGEHLTDVGQYAARGNRAVRWFNSGTLKWESVVDLAPSRDGGRSDTGRIVVRTLGNGKRVFVPVEGL